MRLIVFFFSFLEAGDGENKPPELFFLPLMKEKKETEGSLGWICLSVLPAPKGRGGFDVKKIVFITKSRKNWPPLKRKLD